MAGRNRRSKQCTGSEKSGSEGSIWPQNSMEKAEKEETDTG
jgi:hypothetical protein